MSSDLEKLMLDDEQPHDGLTIREQVLITRLSKICGWLATMSRKDATKRVIDDFGETQAKAERWIRKAEHFMSTGMFENAEDAKRLYANTLMEVVALAREHMVKNVVEVTTKPTKVIVENKADGTKERKLQTVPIVKNKGEQYDAAAASVLLKAAKELAHITGGRPRDVKVRTQLNMQMNMSTGDSPEFKRIAELSNEQLARIAGYEDAEVLQEDAITKFVDQSSPDEEGEEDHQDDDDDA